MVSPAFDKHLRFLERIEYFRVQYFIPELSIGALVIAVLQTVRHWVLRFNADGPEGLIDGKSTGAPPRLTPEQKGALARVVEDGPTPYLDGVVRWRLCDLVSWLHETFDVTLDQSTVNRTLRDMGYRKLTARPRHHAGDPAAHGNDAPAYADGPR